MDAGSLGWAGIAELREGRESVTAETPDRELVTAARGGDRRAFDLLVTRHAPKMIRLASGMLGRVEEAEDVTQEAFSRAFRRLAHFRAGSEFSTWIYRITLNLCRDALRRRKVERRSPLSDEETDGVCRLGMRGPAGSAADAEEMALLLRGLDRLPPKQRAALLLRVNQGLSHAEISEVLGTTVATSRVYLAQARKALFDLWKRVSVEEGAAE